jgi:hypothetical protein
MMFSRNGFVDCFFLTLYVYQRVMNLCASGSQKILITLVAAVLVVAFPVTETLLHSSLLFSPTWRDF